MNFQNFFLAIGVVAIVVMACTFDVSYAELWANLCHAGYWCVAVFVLWGFIYLMNAVTWRVLLGRSRVPFWQLCKMTVTGFALNYTTPVGLLGGEPYRILALTPHVGAERATSSVTLFAMTHIFSHFWFWTVSIVLFICLHAMNTVLAVTMGAFALFCATGILLFVRGYRHGLIFRLARWCTHIPGLRGRMGRLVSEKEGMLRNIDSQISSCSRGRLVAATLCEFSARIVGCLEIYFILLTQTSEFSFFDCVFIQAFQSLFSNLLFFVPLQAGTREGGFAMAMGELGGLGRYGVYTGLITRVREMLWIAIGLAFIKVGNSNPRNLDVSNSRKPEVKALLFDYGGTIDTGGCHWSEVILRHYRLCGIEVEREAFRAAYVQGERALDVPGAVLPTDNMLDLLRKKLRVQAGHLNLTEEQAEAVAQSLYRETREVTARAAETLRLLSERYPLIMVSNFYGNLRSVLADFGLLPLFRCVVESAVEGVRKPDPELWRRGVERSGFPASQCLAVGDSFGKDIMPAHSLGCPTAWVKGVEWEPKQHDESIPRYIVTNISQLPPLLLS